MSTVTLAHTHGKTDILNKLRAFAAALYAAHGGWLARNPRERKLVLLGASYENYAPALAAELHAIDAQR